MSVLPIIKIGQSFKHEINGWLTGKLEVHAVEYIHFNIAMQDYNYYMSPSANWFTCTAGIDQTLFIFYSISHTNSGWGIP